MVLYLDVIFFFNFAVDALVMYLTALWVGFPIRMGRLMLASALGGTYSVILLLPACSFLGCVVGKGLVALAMIRIGLGEGDCYFRCFLIFMILSCAMGGLVVALSQMTAVDNRNKMLIHTDWKVFTLVTVMCYFALSVAFRGERRHMITRQLKRGCLECCGRKVDLTILLDTGNTLTDPILNCPVMIVERTSLEEFWTKGEGAILSRLEEQGAMVSMIELNDICPGRFRLMPYRAVGVRSGFLVSFQADNLFIGGNIYRKVPVAISPTPLSECGEFSALWGMAEECGEVQCAA